MVVAPEFLGGFFECDELGRLSPGEFGEGDFAGAAAIDGDTKTGVPLPRAGAKGEPPFVQLEFAEPFTARSVDVALTPAA